MTTTPFPLNHSTQIPDNALLDISGKQTYLGNAFILPQNGKSLSDENEDVILLISNPSTSGKSLFVNVKKLSTDNNNILIRFYLNPTVSATGSATSPLNLRSGYSSITTSVANCYLAPSITTKGTFIAVIPATIYSITSDVLNILDPGASLLVTGQQTATGTSNAFVELSWYEL